MRGREGGGEGRGGGEGKGKRGGGGAEGQEGGGEGEEEEKEVSCENTVPQVRRRLKSPHSSQDCTLASEMINTIHKT